jgi:hypothetical protein
MSDAGAVSKSAIGKNSGQHHQSIWRCCLNELTNSKHSQRHGSLYRKVWLENRPLNPKQSYAIACLCAKRTQ